jgi:flagellar assembly protein FliH
MSSTSRVLREDELSEVSPIWWRDGGSAPPPAAPPQRVHAPVPAGSGVSDAEREREAHQRGFAEGKALGREQAAAELTPLMDRLGRALADLSSLRARIRTDAEKDLLKLSIAIARRVLHRELTLDPESIEGLIKVALDKLQSRELCRVRVHPDQESAIKSSLERFSNSQKIEVVADPTLQCGDVLFETAHGTLDASIEAQLREIERGFADRLKK